MRKLTVNWSIPSFVNVCIDEQKDGELAGRYYHKYAKDAVPFEHFMDMVKQMEALFDAIQYPQETVRKRSFIKEEQTVGEKKELVPVWTGQELGEERGKLASFYVLVKGRANTTWQGEVIWVEQGVSKKFRSVMELLILMDNALK